MPTRSSRWLFLLAAAATFTPTATADIYSKAPPPPDHVVLPKPTDVKAVAIYPTQVALKGLDDAAQLVVTATLNDGRLQDLSGDVQYAVGDAKVARVLSGGRVVPLANGSTQLVAKFGDKSVTMPVAVKHADENLPIN